MGVESYRGAGVTRVDSRPVEQGSSLFSPFLTFPPSILKFFFISSSLVGTSAPLAASSFDSTPVSESTPTPRPETGHSTGPNRERWDPRETDTYSNPGFQFSVNLPGATSHLRVDPPGFRGPSVHPRRRGTGPRGDEVPDISRTALAGGSRLTGSCDITSVFRDEKGTHGRRLFSGKILFVVRTTRVKTRRDVCLRRPVSRPQRRRVRGGYGGERRERRATQRRPVGHDGGPPVELSRPRGHGRGVPDTRRTHHRRPTADRGRGQGDDGGWGGVKMVGGLSRAGLMHVHTPAFRNPAN